MVSLSGTISCVFSQLLRISRTFCFLCVDYKNHKLSSFFLSYKANALYSKFQNSVRRFGAQALAFSSFFSVFVPCAARLSWPSRQLLSTRRPNVSHQLATCHKCKTRCRPNGT